MTFFFDGGDILIIICVGIAFYLSKRFDKTGRSLKKVRSYAEKTKSELDKWIKQKTDGISNSFLDLEVQEETNKTIYSHIEDARNEIIMRTDELEDRVKQIEVHERALDELNDLALRVDENLSRLKDESIYVDEVGGRLNDIREKFSSLEEKDKARFAAFRSEVLADLNSEILNLRDDLSDTDRQLVQYKEKLDNLNTQRDGEMQAGIAAYQDSLTQVETVFNKRREKTAEEGLQLEDDVFSALKEKIDSDASRLEAKWLGGINELRNRISSTAASIQDELKETRNDMDTVKNQFQELEESIQSRTSTFDERLEKIFSAASDDSRLKLKEMDEHLQAVSADCDDRLEEMEKRIRHAAGHFDTGFVDLEDSMQTSVDELENRLKVRIQSSEKSIETSYSQICELEGRIQTISLDSDSNLTELEKQIQSDVTELEDRLGNQVEAMSSEHEIKLVKIQEQLQTETDNLESQLKGRLQSASDNFNTDLDELKVLEEQVQSASDSTESSLMELQDKVQSSIKKFDSRLEEHMKSRIDKLDKQIDEHVESAENRFNAGLEEVKERVQNNTGKLESHINDRLKTVSNDFGNSFKELQELEQRMSSDASDLEKQLDAQVQSAEEGFNINLAELEERFQAESSSIESRLERKLQMVSITLDNRFNELQELEKRVQSTAVSSDESMANLEKHMESSIDRLNRETEENLRLELSRLNKYMEDEVSSISSKIDSDVSRLVELVDTEVSNTDKYIEERIQVTSDGFDEILRETEKHIQSNVTELDKKLDELEVQFVDSFHKKESKMLESIENHQFDYKKEIENRFKHIEGFIHDMDVLAESLKASQQKTVEDFKAVYKEFDDGLRVKRENENKDLEKESIRIRRIMTDLEKGLDSLKERAYDNVSEKLQDFEDSFFADIKNRSSELKESLDEWQRNADLEIEELSLKAVRQRDITEQQHSAELKQKLADLQSHVFNQIDAFQVQVDTLQASLTGRIEISEKEIIQFRESLSEKLAAEKKSALVEFHEAFGSMEGEIDEMLSKSAAMIKQEITDFSREMEEWKEDLANKMQQIQNNNDDWKIRVNKQMSESERNVMESVDTLQVDFTTRITDIQDEFKGRTEQLILESDGERTVIVQELSDMRERVDSLSDELIEKRQETMDDLKKQKDSFLLEFRRNSQETKSDLERKIRDLKQLVQDSRSRIDSSRNEMISRIDEDSMRLSENLNEIDRRQKDFIAETGIFKRADELKGHLKKDLAELKRQIEVVGSSRVEIQEISQQYEHVMSLYSDVNIKMSRFLTEQQKVDNLEGKIARISGLSESIEHKLDRVNDTHDTLLDLQVRLKQLEDLQKDLTQQYDRLSATTRVLDKTTEGVDSNFQQMVELEDSIRKIGDSLVSMKEHMKEVAKRQAIITDNKKRIDTAVDKVATLDSTILELDSRLEELGKVREWLARAETRLGEINTETQQHIRLLGSLSRQDNRKDPGLPDMSTREMIERLAKQNWDPLTIANYTKISRSEVELILNLMPGNKK